MRLPAAGRKEEKPSHLRYRIPWAAGFLCFAFIFSRSPRVLAVPACPEPAVVEQPDGTVFLARRVGDERWNCTETEEGYTIIHDAETGFWLYAVESEGELKTSSFPVVSFFPETFGIKKHLRPRMRPRKAKAAAMSGEAIPEDGTEEELFGLASGMAPASPEAPVGSIKSLVILARFADHMTYVTQTQFDKLLNEVGHSTDGAVGSVRDYYLDVSAGQLSIDSTVMGWVTLPRNESFYGADNPSGEDSSPWQLVRDAVQALDKAGFDFRPFDGDRNGEIDMLTIIHSGLSEEYVANPSSCVWSQSVELTPAEIVDAIKIYRAAIVPERRYDATSITRIGVICHEIGHLLRLPDLYDSDGSSSGIGVWGLMGVGSWGGDAHSPERPVHLCSWSKVQLGWIKPTEIDGSDSPVSVPAIEKAGTSGVYKVSCEMADGEYLLIENRWKTGYDLKLPASGLLIWHIDDNQPWNSDETHYWVGLLQADGAKDLEEGSNRGDAGDPFPGTSNKRSLDDATSPNTGSYYNGLTHIALSKISDPALTMTFEISTLSDLFSEDFSEGLPANWRVIDGSDDGYTWTDQNPRNRSDPNWSGKFMIADSDAASWRPMNEQLISPEIDCSLYVHTRIKFSHYFGASGGQTGDIDGRVDGSKWQNVARYKFNDDSGTENIDISSLADGHSSVQVRWHFYDISYGWYWGIDNVALRGELPANSSPQVSISNISQRRDGSGHLEIRFVGKDPENDPATWAAKYCSCSASPYTTWQPLVFDTADPASTAVEPMPFSAGGKALVAVVDASTWNGPYKVRLRVTNGVTSNPAVISNEFMVDNTPPNLTTQTYLQSNPSSGASSLTALSSWEDSTPGVSWFQLSLNAGAWSAPIQGVPSGAASQAATFSSLSLDGDDYLSAKSYHVDAFGNRGQESVSPAYYVTPLTPSFPAVSNPTPNSLVVIVKPNPSERGSVDYAVYCSSAQKYVNSQTGGLLDSPSWGSCSQWGGSSGTTVVGLKSKTTYSFQVIAANPNSHDSRSSPSSTGSAATRNSPPNPPASVQVSPERPLTSDNLVCTATPASPPDPDAEDTISFKYTWSCPGKPGIVHGPKPEMTDYLSSSSTRKGETWTCTVQGYDLWEYGPGVSASVVIRNTPPSRVSSVRLSPASPKTTDDLVCTVTPAGVPDADVGDAVSYKYTWTCPGKETVVHGPNSALRDVLPSHLTTKNDKWTCTVEPYDGDDFGPALSAQVLVVNTPPLLEVFGQRGAYAGQSIQLLIISFDHDHDATSITCPSSPPGATLTQNPDGTADFLWPNPSLDIREEVTFSASDGTDETSRKLSLTFSQQPFLIASVSISVGDGGEFVFVVTWFALPGVVYSIQRSRDLLNWQTVATAVSLPEDAGEPGWLTYRQQIGAPTLPLRFYRLGM